MRGLERGWLVSGEDALAVADGVVRPVSGDPLAWVSFQLMQNPLMYSVVDWYQVMVPSEEDVILEM